MMDKYCKGILIDLINRLNTHT